MLPALPARAATLVQTTYVAERTTTGPAALDLAITLDYHNTPGGERLPLRVGAIGLIDGEHPVAIPTDMKAASDDVYGGLYGPGTYSHTCGDLGYGCGATGQVGASRMLLSFVDDGGTEDVLTRLFVVTEGQQEAIVEGFKLDGWRLRKHPLTFAFADREDTTSVGVDAPNLGAEFGSNEVFVSAELPGGEGGTVAMAEAPCSRSTTGVPRGIGSATLTGGTETATLRCPYDPVSLAGHLAAGDPDAAVDEVDYAWKSRPVAAYAPAATQWKFQADGAVVGQTTQSEARLLVIDLPPFPEDLPDLPWFVRS